MNDSNIPNRFQYTNGTKYTNPTNDTNDGCYLYYLSLFVYLVPFVYWNREG